MLLLRKGNYETLHILKNYDIRLDIINIHIAVILNTQL